MKKKNWDPAGIRTQYLLFPKDVLQPTEPQRHLEYKLLFFSLFLNMFIFCEESNILQANNGMDQVYCEVTFVNCIFLWKCRLWQASNSFSSDYKAVKGSLINEQ